jgi:hypothetical protein
MYTTSVDVTVTFLVTQQLAVKAKINHKLWYDNSFNKSESDLLIQSCILQSVFVLTVVSQPHFQTF